MNFVYWSVTLVLLNEANDLVQKLSVRRPREIVRSKISAMTHRTHYHQVVSQVQQEGRHLRAMPLL